MEIKLMRTLVAARYAQSLTLGAYSYMQGLRMHRNLYTLYIHMICGTTVMSFRIFAKIQMCANLQQEPDEYVLITAKTGWKTLAEFWRMPSDELNKVWTDIVETYVS